MVVSVERKLVRVNTPLLIERMNLAFGHFKDT